MSIEQQIASLTTATTDLLNAVNVKKAALDSSVLEAQNYASSASADKDQTAEDRIQTGLDRIATGEDRLATGADRVQTSADRVQTGLDAQATAADRIKTTADAAATAADRAQTSLDAAASTAAAGTATAASLAAASSATSALAQAGNAATSAGAAATSQTTAATNAATAATKASEAAASAAAAASAVLGQTTSKLVLDVVDQTVFASTTLVDAVIYDTSKDSDGGKWRQRCQHTSWYQEAIFGTWLGSASSEANARAISGATTNDYYYDTTAAKFYALNAGSGRTEVFRGNVREFPARVLITAETNRVVIWDLTVPGCPMWMVLTHRGTAGLANTVAVAALQGRVCLGGIASFGVTTFAFVHDGAWVNQGGGRTLINGTLAALRNTATLTDTPNTAINLINSTVNDVALTVLPDAPIDPVTGLAAVTIAAATDGGVSVIKHDGTVANITFRASFGVGRRVAFTPSNDLVYTLGASGGGAFYVHIFNGIPTTSVAGGDGYAKAAFDRAYYPSYTSGGFSADLSPHANPNQIPLSAMAMGRNALWQALSSGLIGIRENPSTPAKGMLAYSTIAYASGWLPGDIRGAWITAADGVSETLTGVELVTNGTFDVDGGGWTLGASWSVADGALVMGGAVGSYNAATTNVSTIPGKNYELSFDVLAVSGNSTFAIHAWAPGLDTWIGTNHGTGRKRFAFTATAVTSGVGVGTNGFGSVTATIDNISVREVIPDRSVKNNGLVINGSLTKAPVAAGAGLCALSGFSATNYLEQPYSPNLDFGTGDFCVMGWAYLSTPYRTLLARGKDSESAARAGNGFMISSGATADVVQGSTQVGNTVLVIQDSGRIYEWNHVVFLRRNGIAYLQINGNLAQSSANTQDISSVDQQETLYLGRRHSATNNDPFTSGKLALWRISASAPSDDQLKAIYETEKKLFKPNAQCTLAGNSNAVTALAYDEDTDLLHVGTSWGRSAFQGLLRVSSEATPVGAIEALAASGGAVVQAGASAVDVYIPAYSLREELERLDDATRALGSVPVFHEFDAVTSQVDFVVPTGFKVVAVYSAGVLKRVGSTKDYTVLNDGFRETVRFAVAPGASAWVSIMTVRA